MSLVARHLEANGIATLCLGSALDIMQAGWAPRAAFVDFPLGHTAGPPLDSDRQYQIMRDGLAAFETIQEPGEIRTLDVSWPEGDGWRDEAARGDGADARMPRDTVPRYQTEEDRLLAEGGSAQVS